MGTNGLNAGGSPAMNFSNKPSTGGEELLLVTLYYRNQHMLWLCGPLPDADVTFLF